MTILTTTYEPDVVYVEFEGEPLPFFFPSTGVESVELYEVGTDTVRTLVPVTEYFIEFFGRREATANRTGGRAFLTRPYLSNTNYISIERNTPITQQVNYDEFGRFYMPGLEDLLDKLTMILQEITFRKCDDPEQLPSEIDIDQLVTFFPYGPIQASTLEFVIDKLTALCLAVQNSKETCFLELGNT